MAVKGVHAAEPMREGEYPWSFVVGFDGVTEITEDVENLGNYGVRWFSVWKEKVKVAKMNALAIAVVQYAETKPQDWAD